MRAWSLLSATLAIGSLVDAPCRAQCAEWDERFALRGIGDVVHAVVTLDDGSGPALYAGGQFQIAGSTAASFVAKWDGTSWTSLPGLNNYVKALAVFDDGSGRALYAGGAFTAAGGAHYVAKWDGASWSALGTSVNGIVNALAVWDDGSGPALYVGGSFDYAGGPLTPRIAKWDGTSWSGLGTGVAGTLRPVNAISAGPGPFLFIGGAFESVGGENCKNIARWDGANWVRLGAGTTAPVNAFVHDGTSLYVGGNFISAGPVLGANHVARWTGAAWSAVGTGVTGGSSAGVKALALFDDGGGPALYAAGDFNAAGGTTAVNVAKWDGSTWQDVDGGTNSDVLSLAVFDPGSGSELYAAGVFSTAGSASTPAIAVLSGASWTGVGAGQSPTRSVRALVAHDDGDGPALFAAGEFDGAGGVIANRVAKWDGSSWSPLGFGLPSRAGALCVFDDGSGPALYAGGPTLPVRKWNGTSWSTITGTDGVFAMAVFDDGTGPALFTGGSFATADGVTAANVAKWNGSTWSALGTGTDSLVSALCVFDDGRGEALYAGGGFIMAGGIVAERVARWDGRAWEAVEANVNADVLALTVFDDGAGPALYAGGRFTTAGGVFANRVAKWNGTAWSALGSGVLGDAVRALVAFDDGSGPALYAAGSFTVAGGTSANRIARWDSASWSALDDGLISFGAGVYALAAFDDGADGATDLYAGGDFTLSGDRAMANLAQWHGCPPGAGYCYGDAIDSVVTTPCPCGNFGDEGHGCANSNAALGGARLIASGTTSPNTIAFTCSGIPNNTFCTFLRSNGSLDTGFAFGDGIKCLNGTGIRFSSQNAGQNGNPSNTVSSGAQAVPPGNTRYYQLHYRNPNAGFCPPEAFNISNGYRLDW